MNKSFNIALKPIVLLALVLAPFSASHAQGPYEAQISSIQATKLGRSDNTVFLNIDVTGSNCAGTNNFNRFTITSEEQQSLILLAAGLNKPVTIFGTGTCNSLNVETISAVRVSP